MALGSSSVLLEAKVISSPVLIGTNRESPLYEILVETPRISGKSDIFYVHYTGVMLKIGELISIVGELRTLNVHDTKPVKGFINAYQLSHLLEEPEGSYGNSISVTNALVVSKKELYSGKEGVVQCFDISVMRSHGRRSIIQCSAWHGVAGAFYNNINEGDRLNLWGSIQGSMARSGNRFISVLTMKFEKVL